MDNYSSNCKILTNLKPNQSNNIYI